MSKTRVYAVFSARGRMGGIHLNRESAEDELRCLLEDWANPRVMEKDINEEEHNELVIDEMKQIDLMERVKAGKPLPYGYTIDDPSSKPPIDSDSYMSNEGWREVTDVPDGLSRVKNR